MHDQQLREQFEDWARPLREAAPPPVAVIRRRARRHVARTIAAGATALAVLGAVGGLVLSGVPGPGGAPGPVARGATIDGSYRFPPGQRYLVQTGYASGQAVVRDAASGRALRVIAPPVPGSQFTWVAAAASDRLFLLADQQSSTGVAHYYALRLGPAGHVASFGLVPHAGATTGQIYGLAVSPDGTEFAVATTPWLPGPGPGTVWVRGLSRPHPAQNWVSAAGFPGALSWAGDARLAVFWQANGNDLHQSGLRILRVPVGQGPGIRPLLASSRLAVPGRQISGSPQITADGSTVLSAVAKTSSGPGASRVRIGEWSATSGRLLRWLPLAGRNSSTHAWCGVLWSSRTGSTVLAQCGHVQQLFTGGRAKRVRLAVIIGGSAVGNANTFAW